MYWVEGPVRSIGFADCEADHAGTESLRTRRRRKADSNRWSHLTCRSASSVIGGYRWKIVSNITGCRLSEFARDSPLEENGFEPSVPLGKQGSFGDASP
jgi:hypothetical protein